MSKGWGSPQPTALSLSIQRLLSSATAGSQRSSRESSLHRVNMALKIELGEKEANSRMTGIHSTNPKLSAEARCPPNTPSKPQITRAKPLDMVTAGAPSANFPICHLCLAKQTNRCFLLLPSFRPSGPHVLLVCCRSAKGEVCVMKDAHCCSADTLITVILCTKPERP